MAAVVRIMPGTMALTLMLSARSSTAAVRVSASTPALAAL